MKITKLGHAALDIRENEGRLLVDPGSFTPTLEDYSGVDAVVITHLHPDHWTAEHLTAVLANSPDAVLFGPAGVASAASGFPIVTVSPGDTVTVGPFTLRFFGGEHAVIHESIPLIDNVGVLINDILYYAGDSFAIPESVQVPVLAAPAGAPWMKISESMDYVTAIAPSKAFFTHEEVLSRPGKNLSHDRLRWATEQGGGEYFAIEAGESLEA